MRANSALYYRHSGAVGIVGPLFMLMLGLAAALVLGGIYGVADWYSPFIYLNFLLTCLLGLAVGIAVGLAAKWAKVRNSLITLVIAGVCGLAAVYAAWITWIAALSEFELVTFGPLDLASVIQMINAKGAWSMKNWTPTGGSLWVIWGVEAAVIVGMAAYCPRMVLGTTPFCERCERWLDDSVTYGPLHATANHQQIVTDLEQGNFNTVHQLLKVPDGAARFREVVLTACPTCEDLQLITVRTINIGLDKEGKETRTIDNIVLNLLLTKHQHTALTQHFDQLPAAVPPPSPVAADELPHIQT